MDCPAKSEDVRKELCDLFYPYGCGSRCKNLYSRWLKEEKRSKNFRGFGGKRVMEFISAEEFLRHPKEVQEVFIKWWNPSIGDLYCNLYNGQQDNILVVNNVQLEFFKTFSNDIKKYGVLLFTEGQLRKFIEDKTNSKLEVLYLQTGYSIRLSRNNPEDRNRIERKLSNNLIQAYWKVACEIAKESIQNGL